MVGGLAWLPVWVPGCRVGSVGGLDVWWLGAMLQCPHPHCPQLPPPCLTANPPTAAKQRAEAQAARAEAELERMERRKKELERQLGRPLGGPAARP
jgi:hypothetical protein